jgi:hypothetical protein
VETTFAQIWKHSLKGVLLSVLKYSGPARRTDLYKHVLLATHALLKRTRVFAGSKHGKMYVRRNRGSS